MKSMPSRKKKKTLTITQKARIAYNKLSKQLQKEIGYSVVRQYYKLSREERAIARGEEISLWRATSYSIKIGYNIDRDGRKRSAYEMMKESIKTPYKHSKRGTLREYFAEFRDKRPDLYAKYNSYMYRLGFSSANYFYDNAKVESEGGEIVMTLELPKKIGGIVYETLTLIKYKSPKSMAEELEAYME